MALCCCIRGSGSTRSTRARTQGGACALRVLQQRRRWPVTWPAAAPTTTTTALFRRADALLFALPEATDRPDPGGLPARRTPAAQREVAGRAVLGVGRRRRGDGRLAEAASGYLDKFGFGFVMCVGGLGAADVLGHGDRPHAQRRRDRAQGGPQRARQDQPDPAGAHAGTRGRLPQLVKCQARSRLV